MTYVLPPNVPLKKFWWGVLVSKMVKSVGYGLNNVSTIGTINAYNLGYILEHETNTSENNTLTGNVRRNRYRSWSKNSGHPLRWIIYRMKIKHSWIPFTVAELLLNGVSTKHFCTISTQRLGQPPIIHFSFKYQSSSDAFCRAWANYHHHQCLGCWKDQT